MRKEAPLEEVDPLALPLGTRVGQWRVMGFRGRGSYGTLYRAERVGQEQKVETIFNKRGEAIAAGAIVFPLRAAARLSHFERYAREFPAPGT